MILTKVFFFKYFCQKFCQKLTYTYIDTYVFKLKCNYYKTGCALCKLSIITTNFHICLERNSKAYHYKLVYGWPQKLL